MGIIFTDADNSEIVSFYKSKGYDIVKIFKDEYILMMKNATMEKDYLFKDSIMECANCGTNLAYYSEVRYYDVDNMVRIIECERCGRQIIYDLLTRAERERRMK